MTCNHLWCLSWFTLNKGNSSVVSLYLQGGDVVAVVVLSAGEKAKTSWTVGVQSRRMDGWTDGGEGLTWGAPPRWPPPLGRAEPPTRPSLWHTMDIASLQSWGWDSGIVHLKLQLQRAKVKSRTETRLGIEINFSTPRSFDGLRNYFHQPLFCLLNLSLQEILNNCDA